MTTENIQQDFNEIEMLYVNLLDRSYDLTMEIVTREGEIATEAEKNFVEAYYSIQKYIIESDAQAELEELEDEGNG